jgi:hypothetical protein
LGALKERHANGPAWVARVCGRLFIDCGKSAGVTSGCLYEDCVDDEMGMQRREAFGYSLSGADGFEDNKRKLKS